MVLALVIVGAAAYLYLLGGPYVALTLGESRRVAEVLSYLPQVCGGARPQAGMGLLESARACLNETSLASQCVLQGVDIAGLMEMSGGGPGLPARRATQSQDSEA